MSALVSDAGAPSAERTPRSYLAIAVVAAAIAQIGFVAIFAVGERAAVRASRDAPPPGELAVAIDAVSDLPLLKYGAANPSKAMRPAARARRGATTPATTPAPAGAATEPSPAGTLPDGPTPAGAADPPGTTSTAGAGESTAGAVLADAGPAAAATTLGSALGSDAGTEVDPLKARAAASYRSQLDGWFSARFHIRGKLAFERLEKLAASVVVAVSNRRVVSFTIASASGDPIFDAQLRADLNAILANGAEVPAPPPTHPELLGATVSLRFACSLRAYCE
jgi:hypothetical protein